MRTGRSTRSTEAAPLVRPGRARHARRRSRRSGAWPTSTRETLPRRTRRSGAPSTTRAASRCRSSRLRCSAAWPRCAGSRAGCARPTASARRPRRPSAARPAPSPRRASRLILDARTLYEWDRLAEAEETARRGLAAVSQSGITDGFGLGRSILAEIVAAAGTAARCPAPPRRDPRGDRALRDPSPPRAARGRPGARGAALRRDRDGRALGRPVRGEPGRAVRARRGRPRLLAGAPAAVPRG